MKHSPSMCVCEWNSQMSSEIKAISCSCAWTWVSVSVVAGFKFEGVAETKGGKAPPPPHCHPLASPTQPPPKSSDNPLLLFKSGFYKHPPLLRSPMRPLSTADFSDFQWCTELLLFPLSVAWNIQLLCASTICTSNRVFNITIPPFVGSR